MSQSREHDAAHGRTDHCVIAAGAAPGRGLDRLAIELFGAERLMVGSDWPFGILAGEDLAIVVPVPHTSTKRRRGREKTEADHEACRRAAGSWKGLVDADKLREDI